MSYKIRYKDNKDFYKNYAEFRKALKAIKTDKYYKVPIQTSYSSLKKSGRGDNIIRFRLCEDKGTYWYTAEYERIYLPVDNWTFDTFGCSNNITRYIRHQHKIESFSSEHIFNANLEYVTKKDFEILRRLDEGDTFILRDHLGKTSTYTYKELKMTDWCFGKIKLSDDSFKAVMKVVSEKGNVDEFVYTEVTRNPIYPEVDNTYEHYYLVSLEDGILKYFKSFGRGNNSLENFVPKELNPIFGSRSNPCYLTNENYNKLISMIKKPNKALVIKGTDQPPYFKWNNNIWESNTTSWYLYLKEQFFNGEVQPWMLTELEE